MTKRSLGLATVLLSLAAIFGFATATGADAPAASGAGELWEVTTAMSMQGFAMPPQTRRSCTATGAQEPAGANAQPGCTTSDFKVAGNKTTWRVVCSGPPAMTGTGEITRNGADAYSGAIRFASEEGEMTLKLNGRRVGACTPGRN